MLKVIKNREYKNPDGLYTTKFRYTYEILLSRREPQACEKNAPLQ